MSLKHRLENAIMLTVIVVGAVFAFSLSACISQPIYTQPVDLSVAATHKGRECMGTIFGVPFETVTLEMAMAHAKSVQALDRAPWYIDRADLTSQPIRKIRSITEVEYWVLPAFGQRCIEVTGEAGSLKAAAN